MHRRVDRVELYVLNVLIPLHRESWVCKVLECVLSLQGKTLDVLGMCILYTDGTPT